MSNDKPASPTLPTSTPATPVASMPSTVQMGGRSFTEAECAAFSIGNVRIVPPPPRPSK